MKKQIRLIVFAGAFLLSGSSFGAVIAADDFTVDGTGKILLYQMTTQSGAGFSNNWDWVAVVGGTRSIVQDRDTDYVFVNQNYPTSQNMKRDFSSAVDATSGVLYVGLRGSAYSSSSAKKVNTRLYLRDQDGNNAFSVCINDDGAVANGGTLAYVSGGGKQKTTPVQPIPDYDLVEVIAKIDFDNNTFTMWMNPTGVESGGIEMTATDLDLSGLTSLSGMGLANTGITVGQNLWDSVAVGTSWQDVALVVPEIASSYRLKAFQVAGNSWNTLWDWENSVDGTRPLAVFPVDDYDILGYTLRTPELDSPIFGANSLTTSGGSVLLKHSGMAGITNFISNGGSIVSGVGGQTQGVHLVNFALNGLTFLNPGTSGIELQIDGWSGNATVQTGSTTNDIGYYGLTIEDAVGFTGSVLSKYGTTEWKNGADISSASYLIASASGPKVILNHDIRVNELMIGGVPYSAGTYSFAVLNAAHDDEFVDGGTGSITVGLGPAPAVPPYITWVGQYPSMGTETNETDDPDLDGLVNLYEWGLGGNPMNSADVGHVPTFKISQVGESGVLEYVHVRRSDAADLGLTYHLEVATDLVDGSWASNDFVVASGPYNSEFDFVTNHVPVDAEDQQFIKLVIESN